MKKSEVFCVITFVTLLHGCSDGSGSAPESTTIPDGFTGVLYGPIDSITESHADWIWGDSINWICQQWSVRNFGASGWFYGTNVPWTSADVYVLESGIDPLSVVAADNFAYTSEAVAASVGDTVFFRGRNGFFGAWTIDAIEGTIGIDSALSGTWYFKAGGGGDFTRELGVAIMPMQQGNCSNF